MLEAREFLYDLVEAITGARLTVTYCRLGGVTNDLPADIRATASRSASRASAASSPTAQRLLVAEPHLRRPHGGRRRDPRRTTRSRGASPGPLLARDRRRRTTCARPSRTSSTTASTSPIPTGTRGDNYDRFNVRLAEIEQSMKIVEQAIAQMPDGPIIVDRPALRPAAEAGGLRLDRGLDEPLQARDRGPEGARRARSTSRPRAATASSASTSSPTAAAGRTACASGRRASTPWARSARC